MAKQRHLSIRADAEMLDKFYFVAKYNGRSGSGQILYLMRTLIEKFEEEHGKITQEDLSQISSKD